MIKKMDPVIHFELPATDTARLQKFYEGAFGWQTTALGAEAGDFVLAFTVETDETTRLPRKRGAINGGFYLPTGANRHIKLTILVDDIQAAMNDVTAAGGTVHGDPFEMPGVGLFVDFTDPEGNVMTLNQDFTLRRLPEG